MRIRLSAPPRLRAGFSLMEVAFALFIAAAGLLAVFAVFPVSLRQSQISRSDLAESSFASALLQTFAGNIRMIDDLSVWNDPRSFWKAAASGTGLPETITDRDNGSKAVHALHERALEQDFTGRAPESGKAGQSLSPMMTYVASGYDNGANDDENVWFVATERTETPTPPGIGAGMVRPAQYLIRLACVRRTARRATGVRNRNGRAVPTDNVYAEPIGKWKGASKQERAAVLPNIYIISVVSTDRGFPDVFIREPVFSQEFTFVHRP